MKTFVKSALLAGAATLALGGGAALAGDAKMVQNKNGSLTISGQITRTIGIIDDGDSTRLRHSNSGQSGTGFDLNWTSSINKDLAVKGHIDIDTDESAQGPNNADGGAGFGGESGSGGANDLDNPKSRIQFVHARMGTLTIGKEAKAADGIAHKSAQSPYGFAPGLESAGSGNTQYKISDGTLSGTTINSGLSSLDCGSRAQGIRYDTPNLMGFSAAVSHSDDGDISAAGAYTGSMGGISVGLRGGFVTESDTVGDDCWQTSLTLKHKSGLGGNIAFARIDEGSDAIDAQDSALAVRDRENMTVQLSFATKMNELGTTTLIGTYQRSHNIGDSSNETEMFAVGVGQELPGGVSIYLKYLNFELEQDAARFQAIDDIDAVEGGVRLKF